MREIKFRAWNGYRIIQDEIHRIEFYTNSSWSIIGKEKFNGVDNLKRDYKIAKSYDCDNKSVLMQYTGLKDKNGAEIYELDIVKGSAYGKEIYTGVVEFYNASFVMRIDGNKGYYRLNKMTFQELEVIGNIYEHEELLGATKWEYTRQNSLKV